MNLAIGADNLDRYCTTCGPIEPGSTFCRHCGAVAGLPPIGTARIEDVLELGFSHDRFDAIQDRDEKDGSWVLWLFAAIGIIATVWALSGNW